MSKLNKPLRLWHGLLAIVAALAIGVAGSAIAGGQGSDSKRGFGPGGFVHVGKYYYGVKAKDTPPGDSQTSVQIKCPRGTQVIGGGGGGFSNTVGEQMINYNGPFDGRDRNSKPEDGWILFEDNFGLEGNEGFAVRAICVS